VIVDKMSEREAAKEFGLARETVRKMLRYSAPPGYRRQQPVRRPKLGVWVGTIDQILEADKAEGKKQRHTAKRIFERLRDEHNYTGGYTIVKDYVRLRKLSQREMFVPLEHPPGDAQAAFGEAMVVIAGVERKAHYLVMDLPQSDDGFVMAFPAETTEAFLEGHNHAFAYFGGVPRTILYDNTKIAVGRILGDGARMKTRAFTELQSHYLFAEKFGRPGKGNDKGKVEGLVGYARRNFMVPRPIRHLGGVQRASTPSMPETAGAQAAGIAADDQRAVRERPGEAAAVAGSTIRSLRQAFHAGDVDVARALSH
jgi:transposase